MKNLQINIIFFVLYSVSWLIEFFVLFKLQNYLLGTLSLYFPMLIFIPHGIRVIGLLVYGYKIFLGLFLAHVVTGYYFIDNIEEILLLSLASIVCVYCGMLIIYKKIQITPDQITINTVLLLAIISSFLNSASNLIMKGDSHINLYNFFAYGVGDIIGTLLIFMILIKIIKITNLKIID